MEEKKKLPFLNKTFLQVAGAVLILLLAILLLWWSNANSWQANPAVMAQLEFRGEYRIEDGDWHPIEPGKHIPATQGDVTLRGNFHMLAPDGEYVGLYNDEMPIALYTNHISLTFYEGDNPPYLADMENPIFGISSCGATWNAYTLMPGVEEPIEILIHNPHSYGNEKAIDELLAGFAFWTGIDFEKETMADGDNQRNTGLIFMTVSFVLLGIALFSTLIHIKNSRLLWLFGLVVLFAGIYFIYSAKGIYFWSDSIVTNTVALGISMMLYMLLLSMVIVHFLQSSKKLAVITVFSLGILDGALLILPVATKIYFYDTWIWWIGIQVLANLILTVCLIWECFRIKSQNNWLCIGAILPLLAFDVDAVMTHLAFWQGGLASKYVFMLLFAATMVVVLRIVPRGINAAAKAKALETEKKVLNAQLTESRISTMMSQIRPHFIYNTLGSIEQLCVIDPEKAGELVHNFAKYLRGNFGELDNPRPIQMSQEMEHVHYYVSIEKVRFPDMTFTFEMNSVDFFLPALSIQPIVENAIKHGLMKLEKGGTIRVVSYVTDSHYCVLVEDDGVGFDTAVLQEDRAHMGIRNIQERLKAMVNGTLEIESTVGTGTKALIKIPKEVCK